MPEHKTWTWATSTSDVGRMIAVIKTKSGASTTEEWPGCERGPGGFNKPTDLASGAWKAWATAITDTLYAASNSSMPGVAAGSSRYPVTVVRGMRVFAGPAPTQ